MEPYLPLSRAVPLCQASALQPCLTTLALQSHHSGVRPSQKRSALQPPQTHAEMSFTTTDVLGVPCPMADWLGSKTAPMTQLPLGFPTNRCNSWEDPGDTSPSIPIPTAQGP
ncbi:unnamed protein product [Coccothraustes coccothraustes]